MADDKRPMLPAPIVHRTLPFCIELCSFELLGFLLVRGGSDEFGYDADGRKFLSKRRLGRGRAYLFQTCFDEGGVLN